MTKKISLLSLVFVAVVLVGCTQQEKDVATTVLTQPDANQQEPVRLASTNYIPYTQNAAAKAQGEDKQVALFFHSKTCGSCAKLEADILANAENIPADTVILKADWDENQDLAAEYDVAKYHTVTFMGDEPRNVKGLFTLEELMAEFDTEVIIEQAGYVAFDEAVLKQAQQEDKQVAVFFHSKTCGSCAKLHENIESNLEDIPEDVVILKADWDEEQDLAAEYEVEKYHTVTFVGEENKNVKGLFTLEELLSNLGA